jgi:hypothetical protein
LCCGPFCPAFICGCSSRVGQRFDYREILGIDVSTAADGAGWLTFWRSLTARCLSGVKLVTSDAHAGLVAAIGATCLMRPGSAAVPTT